MAATPNLEQHNAVAKAKERRDNADGWDTGYDKPYPVDKEEMILANIQKVSPAFVKGYREGKARAELEDLASMNMEEREWWDDQCRRKGY